MATSALSRAVCGWSRVLVPGQLLTQTALPVQQVRGKKTAKKKPAKSKKDPRREAMKEYLKKMEQEKVLAEASLRAAKQGEPLDPEMLNPARKRVLVSLSEEENERRYLLVKEYSRHCMERHKKELVFLRCMIQGRERALKELRMVSEPLYLQALDLKTDLFPFQCSGFTATPPLQGYTPPELEE